mgnify:CR=1 FL=1
MGVPLQIGDKQFGVVMESLCHGDGVVGLFRVGGFGGGVVVTGGAG